MSQVKQGFVSVECGKEIEIRHCIGFLLLVNIDSKIKNNEWTHRARTLCVSGKTRFCIGRMWRKKLKLETALAFTVGEYRF